MYVAQLTTGAFIDTRWQQNLYPHFDAFLSAARSVPWIIQCCFGEDRTCIRVMRDWFDQLPSEEKARRKEFMEEFASICETFNSNPLGNVRHVSVHRTGVAPLTVTIRGHFGVTYTGGPTNLVPSTETRQIDDPNFLSLVKPRELKSTTTDFSIDGQPLFVTCQNYLSEAGSLVGKARAISDQVHGNNKLSEPPSS